MSNVVICRISISLNIFLYSKRGCRNNRQGRVYKMEDFFTKLKNKFGFSDNQSKNIWKKFTIMTKTGNSMKISIAAQLLILGPFEYFLVIN